MVDNLPINAQATANAADTSDFEPSDVTVNRLFARWYNGDADAAAQLYQKYSERVSGVVSFYLNPRFGKRVGRDDMVQTVFLNLLARSKRDSLSFRSDTAFGSWLRKFTKNVVRRRVEHELAQKRDVNRDSQPVEPAALDALASDGAASAPARFELRELIDGVLKQLDGRQREIVELTRQGYSQTEIAHELHLSARTIRRRTGEIRRRLAAAVDETCN